jgi:hypothetical protein
MIEGGAKSGKNGGNWAALGEHSGENLDSLANWAHCWGGSELPRIALPVNGVW